jgi:hypothetical protein
MSTYTVYEPPPRPGEVSSDPECFLSVRDGFYFWAFLLGPLWLLWHRLWLALVIYLIASILLGAGLTLISASSTVEFLAGLLIALLIGFEASTIWRWNLTRRGWKMLGFVVGEDIEIAEQRFFAEWSKHAVATPPTPPAALEPRYSTLVRHGAPSPSDVIGLFPEPGGSR